MNFELAKKLKDAGFKQEGNTWISSEGFDVCDCGVAQNEGQGREGDDVYSPTLPELIDAVTKLGTYFTLSKRDAWFAEIVFQEQIHQIVGDDPISVVARLWITIEKETVNGRVPTERS